MSVDTGGFELELFLGLIGSLLLSASALGSRVIFSLFSLASMDGLVLVTVLDVVVPELEQESIKIPRKLKRS